MPTHDEKMLDDHHSTGSQYFPTATWFWPCVYMVTMPMAAINPGSAWPSQWWPAIWSRDLKGLSFHNNRTPHSPLCIKCLQHVLFITSPLPDKPWGTLLILICQPTLNSILMGLCLGIYYKMKAVCGRKYRPSPASWSHKSYNLHPSMENTILTCHGGVEGLISANCTLKMSSILQIYG